MAIQIDYYLQDLYLHIDMFDDAIIYEHEWSKEILGIREKILLCNVNEANLLQIKKDMLRQYEEKVREYYQAKTEKHLSSVKNKEDVGKFFDNLIGKK